MKYNGLKQQYSLIWLMPPHWGRAQQGRVVSVSCGICRAADLRLKLPFPHGTSMWLAASARCWLSFQLGLSVGVAICSLSVWWLGFLTMHQASSKCAFKNTGNGLALEKAQLHFYRTLLLRQSYDSDSRIDDISFTFWYDKVFWKPCFKMSIAAPWFDLKIPSASNSPSLSHPRCHKKNYWFSKASL